MTQYCHLLLSTATSIFYHDGLLPAFQKYNPRQNGWMDFHNA